MKSILNMTTWSFPHFPIDQAKVLFYFCAFYRTQQFKCLSFSLGHKQGHRQYYKAHQRAARTCIAFVTFSEGLPSTQV